MRRYIHWHCPPTIFHHAIGSRPQRQDFQGMWLHVARSPAFAPALAGSASSRQGPNLESQGSSPSTLQQAAARHSPAELRASPTPHVPYVCVQVPTLHGALQELCYLAPRPYPSSHQGPKPHFPSTEGRGGHLGTRGIDWYGRIWQLLRQPACQLSWLRRLWPREPRGRPQVAVGTKTLSLLNVPVCEPAATSLVAAADLALTVLVMNIP